MEEVNLLTLDGKTARIVKVAEDRFLVEFVGGELAVNAGMFSTQALAEEKGNALLNAEHISADDLAGDVVPE